MASYLHGTIAALVIFAASFSALVGPATTGAGAAGIGPSPIRPEFTRPAGLPGEARAIAPERFWDPAQAKKKRGNPNSN